MCPPIGSVSRTGFPLPPLLSACTSLRLACRSGPMLPAMIDPYDPIHPDGADDPEDLPGAPPLTSISWLDDDDEFESEWQTDFPATP
jgi:hypothetical protein